MRIRKRFLMTWIVLLICVTVFSSSLAEDNLPAIVKKIQPSVVVILAYDEEGEILDQGSGFFINERGDVITNRHVLEGAYNAEVRTADGKVYPIGNVLAEDREGDLILVSVDIPAGAVRPVSVSTTIPEVGERIVVIGTPLGLELTVSDGIVSAVRDIPAFGKIIQMTAPISPGSSGSPVVNMKGEIVGVATFQMVEGQNLNFAIPGERTMKLAPGKAQTLSEWVEGEGELLPDSPEELFYSGLVFVWTEEYGKALVYFEQAVEKDTVHADAYFCIGYCKSELGYYNEAVEAYKLVLRIEPDYPTAYYNLGVTYRELGRYNEAVEAYKQTILIQPDDAGAHYNLGEAYVKLGRYNEAVEAYKQAIRINPDYAAAYLNLGVAYGKLGRYNEAVEAYKQAIRIKADHANAHYNLGVAYGKLGRYNEEVEAYKQAIRIQPDHAEAYQNLGLAYGELGRYNEEVEAYKQAIRINPDYADAYLNLGVAYDKLGQYNEAIEVYKRAIRIKADYVAAHYNLGVACVQLGRYNEGVKAFKQAIRLSPDDAAAHYNLGVAHLLLEDSGSALEEYKILRTLDMDRANKLFEFIPK